MHMAGSIHSRTRRRLRRQLLQRGRQWPRCSQLPMQQRMLVALLLAVRSVVEDVVAAVRQQRGMMTRC